MIKIEKLLTALAEYQKKYRHPSSPALEIESEYCLFPDSSFNGKSWPDTYPHAGRAGVYIVLDQARTVLYVGKASFTNTLGSRLGSYFCYDADGKTCSIQDNWSANPHYLVIVATPEGMEFEAPAIEEYLITKFGENLPDNKIGTVKKMSALP